MLSRCNFYAVTLANSRLCSLRTSVVWSYSACPPRNRTLALCHRPAQKPCHGHDRGDQLKVKSARYYTSGGQPDKPLPPILDNDDKSQNVFQRFKNMAKKYWYIVVPVHLVTSSIWFGSFYFIASSGVDVPALLESLRFPDWIIDKVKNGNSWTSYLVIAYGLYKIFTPLRYMVTLGGTTMTIRYLQRLGYVVGRQAQKKP